MERKTPLYDEHVKLGGSIVPFAGYLLPVQYKSGVIAEHMAVRTKAGLFDVSHMGEVTLKGKDAKANIQNLLCNDYEVMDAGRCRYSPMCNEQGGIVDDLIVYKRGEDDYLIVINAANREKDVNWMRAHLFGEAELCDISDSIAQIALQGPESYNIITKLTNPESLPVKYYSFTDGCEVAGRSCTVSKTGYTGEDGYEIYCNAEDGVYLWNKLLEAGAENGLIPCGLGARDTLRLEAAMPLYGHEMTDDITPFETGLGFAIKMNKQSFIGKDAIAAKGEPEIARVGLRVTGRGIVREHCEIIKDGAKVGESTSGTHCPFIGAPVAMALIDKKFAEVGTPLTAIVRGREVAVEVCPLPFYKRAK